MYERYLEKFQARDSVEVDASAYACRPPGRNPGCDGKHYRQSRQRQRSSADQTRSSSITGIKSAKLRGMALISRAVQTANGEKYDMNAFTCAHRTLPLGTWLRVTNLRNHRSAFVRVNDRGPVPTSRILDLSVCGCPQARRCRSGRGQDRAGHPERSGPHRPARRRT